MHDHLLDAYETYLRSWQASERTIGARMTLARSRFRSWGTDGFTPANVTAFLAADAKGRPRSKWTAATYYNHLNDLCSFLVASGVLAESPMDMVKRGKRPNKRPKPLSDLEVDRVLSVVHGEVRDWIQLALLEGLRAFEIAKVSGEDFSDAGLYVLGKGQVEATLPIHPVVAEMRDRYPRDGYWFPSSNGGRIDEQRISATVGRLFKAMGIDGSIHRCRHTYGTRLLRGGTNIRVVQKLMRHSSLETTAAYLDVTGAEERDAILRLTA